MAILPALDTDPCVHGNMQPLSAIQGFQLWEVGKSLVTYLIRPVRKIYACSVLTQHPLLMWDSWHSPSLRIPGTPLSRWMDGPPACGLVSRNNSTWFCPH